MARIPWFLLLIPLPAALVQLVASWLRRKRKSQRDGTARGYISQQAALPYCFATLLMFSSQGLVATLGALHVVWPQLPAPVTAEIGRAIHLNLSVYWPLLGSMGVGYYFFVQEANVDLYSRPLAQVQFWVFQLSFAGIMLALLLGYTTGREYLEALPGLKLGIILAVEIFGYNLLRTYLKTQSQYRQRVTLVGMLLGAWYILAQYIPNLVSYLHPSVEQMVRFWVVHMTEEMSLELLNISALVSLLLTPIAATRKSLERVLFFNIIITIIGGIFATGHHYYWIGNSRGWLWIGGVFSLVQMSGVLVLGYIGYRGLEGMKWQQLPPGHRLVLALVICSIIYHLFGAALLGMIMSVPQWNRYSHGTYITSAHAHLALFGAVGFLVLAGATYILTQRITLTPAELTRAWIGLALLNLGLLLMSTMLLVSGILQTYLWRIAGLDFMETHTLLRPYLALRAAGGAIFAIGDFLFVSSLVTGTWRRFGLRIFFAH
ncbi:MAG: nitric-oxide reductase [Firmicutes bacterium]|nr:nitric-oxide reductase [Bacillota bacterium]